MSTRYRITRSRAVDIECIMDIYAMARTRMHAGGNPTQWVGWIESRGFRYCGIVTVHDGTPRRAYELENASSGR